MTREEYQVITAKVIEELKELNKEITIEYYDDIPDKLFTNASPEEIILPDDIEFNEKAITFSGREIVLKVWPTEAE